MRYDLSRDDLLKMRDELDRMARRLRETGASHHRLPRGFLALNGMVFRLEGFESVAGGPAYYVDSEGNEVPMWRGMDIRPSINAEEPAQ